MNWRSDVESDPMLIDIPEELEGVRIRLRPLRPGEGELLWEAIEESREHLGPWQMWLDWHETSRHSELDVRRARFALLRREAVPYGIWHREDGRLLGRIQLEHINWRARALFESAPPDDGTRPTACQRVSQRYSSAPQSEARRVMPCARPLVI